jgi:putative transposase
MDIGVKILASFFVDDETTPAYVIKAGELLQYNAIFNEKSALLQERLDTLNNELKALRRRGKTYLKHDVMEAENADYRRLAGQRDAVKKQRDRLVGDRRNYVNDFLHKTARRVLEQLQKDGVGLLYVSRNLGSAYQQIGGMNKKQRRRFHALPLMRFIDYLELNCHEYGIVIEEMDEAYTSKSNPLTASVLEIQKERAAHDKKEEERKKTSERHVPEHHEPSGTALCGRRAGRAYIAKDGKDQWHADVSAAANHIIVGSQKPIEWSKAKRHKLHAPVVVHADRTFQSKHGLFPIRGEGFRARNPEGAASAPPSIWPPRCG